ncbi:MAG: alanine--tRNA ligase, partial [Duncaniella sp.]|nr:alanine--tRNA ligase [Duncaniella sp.]
NAELRRQAEEFMQEKVNNMAKTMLANSVQIGGRKVVALNGFVAPDMVKSLAFLIRQLSPENTAFLAATFDLAGKPLITVAFTNDLVESGLNASVIARNAAKAIKGGGGGQPGFAQAGGKDKDGLSSAMSIMTESLA